MLNGLDLFSGIGGISLALRDYVRPIAYCEIDPYCQGVLLSRMVTGDLCKAPIWDDIRTLEIGRVSSAIDIICGGFPCQDISCAGNGKGLEGERSGLFFEIVRLAKEIKPKFIFLENVPAITSRGGLQIVREITEMGYDCRWCVIPAAIFGAPIFRERWFILAKSNGEPSRKTYKKTLPVKNKKNTWIRSSRQDRGDISKIYWNEVECPLCGVDNGDTFDVDKLRALGNAVVPIQAKEAFEILMGLKDLQEKI